MSKTVDLKPRELIALLKKRVIIDSPQPISPDTSLPGALPLCRFGNYPYHKDIWIGTWREILA